MDWTPQTLAKEPFQSLRKIAKGYGLSGGGSASTLKKRILKYLEVKAESDANVEAIQERVSEAMEESSGVDVSDIDPVFVQIAKSAATRLGHGKNVTPDPIQKSLLILGVPRSMTTKHYGMAREMIPSLASPTTTVGTFSSGEWLNRWKQQTKWRHYTQPTHGHADAIYALLDEFRMGHVVNDVTQTPITIDYLNCNPDEYNVVVIRRPLADSIYAAHEKQWWWMLEVDDDLHDHTLHNMASAFKTVRSHLDGLHLSGTRIVVDYDDLITEPELWYDTLASLGYETQRMTLVFPESEEFLAKRKATLMRRQSEKYQLILAHLSQM